MSSIHRGAALGALAAGVGFALSAQGPALAQMAEEVKAEDWPHYHRTLEGGRYSPLAQIDAGNVADLRVAWVHQPGAITHGLQATPVAVDGVVYYSGSYNRVFALDGATGDEIWHYYAELDPITEQIATSPYNRGVTYSNGNVYIGTSDGRAIGLDGNTGKELWQTTLVDTKSCGCLFTSPPLAIGDKLIYGLHRRRHADPRRRHLRRRRRHRQRAVVLRARQGRHLGHDVVRREQRQIRRRRGLARRQLRRRDPTRSSTAPPTPPRGSTGRLRATGRTATSGRTARARAPATTSTAPPSSRSTPTPASSSGTSRSSRTTTGTSTRPSANSC